MADASTIAKQFIDYYYQLFRTDRNQLRGLYKENSMLTWEGEQFLGVDRIVEKLASLPFGQIQHKITSQDAQPSNPQGTGIFVLVTGQLLVDAESNPMPFSQAFQLVSDAPNQFFLYNDVFRLN